MVTSPEPITHKYVLRSDPDRAFVVYTTHMGRWWDPRYTLDPATFRSVTIEPWVGGRVYATHTDLGRHDWGEVTIWEPGRQVEHTFTLAQDPDDPTMIAARFAPGQLGSGCSFWFEHRGWSRSNVAARERFGDWPAILDRFTALADASV